ncbi:MAG: hypothetical protein J6R77_00420 [Clostridia bacterium]|nr:hypothetical protein [Clostridia bacterium]
MASTTDNSFASESLLKARVEDAVRLCQRRDTPVFIGFLDAAGRAAAEGMVRPFRDVTTRFWGGHEEGERTLLGVFPSFMEAEPSWFPLTAIGFTYRAQASITHRDVLGSLLATGIRREMLGDILCAPGLAVVFVKDELVPFLQEQVVKIGGEGVLVTVPFEGELPVAHTFRELRDTVASPRLDAVLKVCLSTSREEAARRIAAGLVSVNHRPCLHASAEIKAGDILSVRGTGRFRVEQVGPQTRKGRLFITINQYV